MRLAPTHDALRQALTTVQRGFNGLWVYACYAMVEDGVVNLRAARRARQQVRGPISPMDMNEDGVIDGDDLSLFTNAWVAGDRRPT